MIESVHHIVAIAFYCIVGPAAVIASYASLANWRIQRDWYRHYLITYKEST